MPDSGEFFNLYNHNFIRVAVAIPEVRVADPDFNGNRTVALMEKAAEAKACIVVFPELGLSAYSCDDLFHQEALLQGCRSALGGVLAATGYLPLIGLVGMPLQIDSLLFNCAVVIQSGRILGIIPKSYLPTYREFYELRQFTPADCAVRQEIDLLGQHRIPFGNRLLFRADDHPFFVFAVEICEDVWSPIPPSSAAALAGATVLFNLSASNVTVKKDEYRRQLVGNQSARCIAAYVYCAAGAGESTTDLAWDSHGLIYENGMWVAESKRFSYDEQIVTGDIDLERLAQERMRMNSFSQTVRTCKQELSSFRTVPFKAELPNERHLFLDRVYERFPFVPSDPGRQEERCHEVYEIQVQGLVKRLHSSGIERVIIGISGGLDSTQALIVCARAMDVMNHPRINIIACSMPGFATGERTRDQARRLMEALGCTPLEIDIRPSCMQMLKDIGHPYAAGEPVYDHTFENVQAGERTSHLFRLANLHGGIVVGTSDLSELALGWCTYGVGDHMAHYHVNASVPKTLIQFLIRWAAKTEQLGPEASAVLDDVLQTEISPELVPGKEGDQPTQLSEDVIGPYELQDFTLYHTLRFGFAPPKVAFLAWNAWRDSSRGMWPGIPDNRRNQYGIGQIRHWLRIFVRRFFKESQFKRSCIANAPKVGSGGSLSPRGDWRAPSDGEMTAWHETLGRIPEHGPEA